MVGSFAWGLSGWGQLKSDEVDVVDQPALRFGTKGVIFVQEASRCSTSIKCDLVAV